jgi:xylan 1,4-beta-xylosidase
MDNFLTHVVSGTNHANGKIGTPTDFLSFHAKGSATFIEGHVQLNLATHLKTIDEGFAKIAAVPALRDRPIIIGESDPEACAACQGPQLAYRNSTMYSSYTAASFTRKQDLADKYGVHLEGALTWAFEFEDQRYFAGFRALASNGLDLPVLNVFRMFSLMQGDRIATASTGAIALDDVLAHSVRGQPDVGAFASADNKNLYIMAWHYHDDDVSGPDAHIKLKVKGLAKRARTAQLTHYRIDRDHSNSYSAWQRLGSPVVLDEAQYAQVEAAGKLGTVAPPTSIDLKGGAATLDFALPRQGVSLLVLSLQ